jgi:predicted ATP-dependent endonuclease of OLD family
MLLRFTCQNYLSFRDEVVLDMQPSSKDQSHPDHVVDLGGGLSALRVAALYGANASGKSNLLKALNFVADFARNPPTASRPRIKVSPFRLDKACLGEPSVFTALIAVEGVAYELGFAVTAERVVEEWLYSHGDRMLYERESDGTKKVSEAGKEFFGRVDDFLQVWLDRTPANALLITEGNRIEIPGCQKLFRAIEQLDAIKRIASSLSILASVLQSDEDFRLYLQQLLRDADAGVGEIRTRFVKSAVPIRDGSTRGIRMEVKDVPVLYTSREGSVRGEMVDFQMSEHSSGTVRLIELSQMLHGGLRTGGAYIIDELERSLHPLLSRLLLQEFFATPDQSQLIFATHETYLLDLACLRRDEIHFVSKDRSGNSEHYCLVDFDVRKDLKIERNYLMGRFGAIPFLGEAKRIGLPNSGATE